jgi:hypothetical protein
MIRSCPQLRFSPANRTTSVSASGDILGRPGQVRRREPSNLCAHRLRVPGEQGIRLGHACKSDVFIYGMWNKLNVLCFAELLDWRPFRRFDQLWKTHKNRCITSGLPFR